MSDIIPRPGSLSVADLPEDDEKKLILPYGVAGKPAVGVVVAVGAGVGIALEAGDKVFFHADHEHKVENVRIVSEDCVIAYDTSARGPSF